MTAAVPDPRFRDQLADEFDDVLIDIRRRIVGVFAPYVVGGAPNTLAAELADEAIPDSYWDAEVEARVQAAAKKRAVEAVKRVEALAQRMHGEGLADAVPGKSTRDQIRAATLMSAADRIRAALTSPAPAPRAEEGQG